MADAPILKFSIFAPPVPRQKAGARIPAGAPFGEDGFILTGSKRPRSPSMETDSGMELDGDVVPTVVDGMDVVATPAVARDTFDDGNRVSTTEAVEITYGTVAGVSGPAAPPADVAERVGPVDQETVYGDLTKAKAAFKIREPMRGTWSDATLRSGTTYTTFFSNGLVYAGKAVRTNAAGATFYEADLDRPIHDGRPVENFLRALADGVNVFFYYPDVVVQNVDEKGRAVGKGIRVHAMTYQQLMDNLDANGLKPPPFMYRVSTTVNSSTGGVETSERMQMISTDDDVRQLFSDTGSNFGLQHPVVFVHAEQAWRDQMDVPSKALRFYSEADLAGSEEALLGGLIDDSDPKRKKKTRSALKKVRIMQGEVASSPAAAAARGMSVDKAIEQIILNIRFSVHTSRNPGWDGAQALESVIAELEQLRETIRASATDAEEKADLAALQKERKDEEKTARDIELLRATRVRAEKRMQKAGTDAPKMREVRKAVLGEIRQTIRARVRPTFVIPNDVKAAVNSLTLDWTRVREAVRGRISDLETRTASAATADIPLLRAVEKAISENNGTPSDDDITLEKIHSLVGMRADLFSLVTPVANADAIKKIAQTLFESKEAEGALPKSSSASQIIPGIKEAAAAVLAFSEPMDDEALAAAERRDEAEETKAALASRNRTRATRGVMTGRTHSAAGRAGRAMGVNATFIWVGCYEPLPSDDPNASVDDAVPKVKTFMFPMSKSVSWENIVGENGSLMFVDGSIFYPAVLEEAVGASDPTDPSSWNMVDPSVLRALRPVNDPLASVADVQSKLTPSANGKPATVAFFVSSPFVFKRMEVSTRGRRAAGAGDQLFAMSYADMYSFSEMGLADPRKRWENFWYNPRSKNEDGIEAHGTEIEFGGYYPLVSQTDFHTWRSMVENGSLQVVRIEPSLQTRDEKKMMAAAMREALRLDQEAGSASETSSPVASPPAIPERPRRRIVESDDEGESPPPLFQ